MADNHITCICEAGGGVPHQHRNPPFDRTYLPRKEAAPTPPRKAPTFVDDEPDTGITEAELDELVGDIRNTVTTENIPGKQ
jgi:hypothetical protein